MRENSLFGLFVLWQSFFFTWGGATPAACGGRARGISSTVLKRLALFPRAGRARSISEHLLAGSEDGPVAVDSAASEALPRSPSLCGYRGRSLLV